MNYKHGLKGTRLYRIWNGIKNRCFNPNYHRYSDYGGRGIKVCDEWKNDFQSFYDWSMSNGYSDNLTIDRINNDGNYEPSNCRWVGLKVQANNSRHCNNIQFNGEVHSISEWARITGIPRYTLNNRINKYGWSIEDSLTKPNRTTNKKR